MDNHYYPSLYQINTRVWLRSLSQQMGRPISLDDIPDAELERLAALGFDWLYLLTVWRIGEAGRQMSLTIPLWRAQYAVVLPDLQDEDICGSGFAIGGYELDPKLGEPEALGRLRDRLHQRGMKLMTDFVPNHTAIDHPWTWEHPEFYVQGTPEQLAAQPQNYLIVQTSQGERILAHGRDPYFDGWADTLQLNYGNPDLQEALLGELLRIAGWCDGVRCDMAMLVLPEVFERTWGISSQPFWPHVTETIRQAQPGFVFMAEVYWGLERTLQAQGFDYTYDKRLYDFLGDRNIQLAGEYLWADLEYQGKSVRFLENHDEQRAAVVFSAAGTATGPHQAAAILTYLSPGLRFFHYGQLEGWSIKIPVQLGRGPQQPSDPAIQGFYTRLLEILHMPLVRQGNWRLLACDSPAGSCIAFAWEAADGHRLIGVVNYADKPALCVVYLPWEEFRQENLPGDVFPRRAIPAYAGRLNLLMGSGWKFQTAMNLEFPAWGYLLFEMQARGDDGRLTDYLRTSGR